MHILDQINSTENKLQVGYIYETFRQAKEEIRNKMGNKTNNYLPFWNVIDKSRRFILIHYIVRAII